VAVDDTGNVYVTGGSAGSSASCFTTIKYNSSGVQQWAANYYGSGNGPNGARSLRLDNYGNIYVTGEACLSSALQTDIVTIKYNPSGVQQWIASYHSTPNESTWGRDLVLDNSGNIFVTGSRNTLTDNPDFVTIKYNSSGIQQWVAFNGPANI
jgi:hypothetical protein